MTARAELMRGLRDVGLRMDDAAVAADFAIKHQRAQRNLLIVSARQAGLTIRRIASIVEVDPAYVHRVLTRAGIKSTPAPINVTPRPAGKCRGSSPNNPGKTAPVAAPPERAAREAS